MYIEETKPSNLAKNLLIFNYVFVDTCSLMEDSFPAFMDLLVKSRSYWKGDLEVVILGEVLDELKKHSANREKPDLRVSALRALKIINHDKRKLFGRTFSIWKSKSDDGFVDHALFTIVSDLRIKNKILVITQDKTLARELRSMNDMESTRGRYIIIDRINRDGDLEENPGENGYRPNSRKIGAVNAPKLLTASKERKQLPAPKDVKEIKAAPKLTESLMAIQSNDKRISANISNPNYPADRKISDINNQLALINKENKKDISSLNLAYDGQKLSETLKKLSANADKKPVEAKKKEEVKQAQKAPKKAKPEPKAWFEFGSNPFEAAMKACTNSSIIPHKKEIDYVREVHGEANITIEELQSRLDKVNFDKVGTCHELRFNTVIIKVEKTEKDYKATLNKVEAQKKEAKQIKVEPKKDKVIQEVKTVETSPVKEEVKTVEAPKVDESKKEEPKPVKKKKQAAPKKKEETPLESPKPAEKPVEEKVEEPKAEKHSKELEDALASEKVLKCNANNPNYPVESKIKALEAQLVKARALKESDRRKLGWGIRELQRRLSELKK